MAPSWSWPRPTGMVTPRSRGGSPNRESWRCASSAADSASWPSTAARWRRAPTSSPTAAADASGASLYAVLHPPPDPEHVPSTLVRPAESPTLARFIDHVDIVVTLHGYGRSGMFTALLLGGRNRGLAATIGERLRPALDGYDVVTDLDAIPRELRGLHPDNPVNLPRLDGVQIELPPRVRGLGPKWADWTRGRVRAAGPGAGRRARRRRRRLAGRRHQAARDPMTGARGRRLLDRRAAVGRGNRVCRVRRCRATRLPRCRSPGPRHVTGRRDDARPRAPRSPERRSPPPSPRTPRNWSATGTAPSSTSG